MIDVAKQDQSISIVDTFGAYKFNLKGIYLGSSFVAKISILQSSPTQIDHHSNSFVVLRIHQKFLHI